MKIRNGFVWVCLVLVLLLTLASCNPMETSSKTENISSSAPTNTESVTSPAASIPDSDTPHIHSADNIMSIFFDISLFDEENYSTVFLGKKFKFNAKYAGDDFAVPTDITKLSENGWNLASGQNLNSSVMASESLNLVLEREDGKKVSAVLYNASEKSAKLKDCKIVKFRFENDFYKNPNQYSAFQVNGINNGMAITDIIDTLGTPSHFYRTAPDSYYLDYFISKNDRRNGITIYINPQEDNITAVEISNYQ